MPPDVESIRMAGGARRVMAVGESEGPAEVAQVG